jgi:hypothetical protein
MPFGVQVYTEHVDSEHIVMLQCSILHVDGEHMDICMGGMSWGHAGGMGASCCSELQLKKILQKLRHSEGA